MPKHAVADRRANVNIVNTVNKSCLILCLFLRESGEWNKAGYTATQAVPWMARVVIKEGLPCIK